MTRKKHNTISTEYRKRTSHSGVTKSVRHGSQCKKLDSDDDHYQRAMRFRAILYWEHQRKMLEPQQHL